MKKTLLLSFSFYLFVQLGYAQLNYHRFSAGVNIGAVKAFMDTKESDLNLSFGATADMYLLPNMFISSTYSNGKFSLKNADIYGRSFKSSYNQFSAMFNITSATLFKPGWRSAYLPQNNIYLGGGIGGIFTTMQNPNNIAYDSGPLNGDVKANQQSLFIPVNVGINFNILGMAYESIWTINLNYQHNFSFSDMLDGYDPALGNKYKDSFGVVTIGFRYNFMQQSYLAEQQKSKKEKVKDENGALVEHKKEE
ncbi:hypothetical protein [Solitalea lacus]|uniref:hypothetical protein n=1 Tax=Solitalea lacus TaxID=2911172 RepID=UPI001EDBEEBE|nr:hypothetical protein [Solitalea lacus]UKJ07064.1 hypothetical protein L2B55_16230 [Solitalea lacus]